MPTLLTRCCLIALAVASSLLIAGCDDVEVGGVGASAALPTAFTNGATDTPNLGVGNVHWIGNPNW